MSSWNRSGKLEMVKGEERRCTAATGSQSSSITSSEVAVCMREQIRRTNTLVTSVLKANNICTANKTPKKLEKNLKKEKKRQDVHLHFGMKNKKTLSQCCSLKQHCGTKS